MNRLTRQERTVICIVLFLLVTGWLVKTYRITTEEPVKTGAPIADSTSH